MSWRACRGVMIMTRVAYYVTIVSAAAVMAELLSGCRCLGPADWGMPGADTRWGLFCTVRSLTRCRARAGRLVCWPCVELTAAGPQSYKTTSSPRTESFFRARKVACDRCDRRASLRQLKLNCPRERARVMGFDFHRDDHAQAVKENRRRAPPHSDSAAPLGSASRA